ncbi:flagellar filament capping protein FliD [Halomonas sp. QX-2]|jgi:flagellar hook-associated protein 2|uniref:Flagellar hook-associated protein 2 n=1 Tax=Vreelandella sedimenti TaxID=2729618 RepID=A0A7Z0SNP3_9GAMM|nr:MULTISPECIES: flagellar filament capping protein FliD [Halomonas]NYT75022.1 flagellar filament capping protein FliD [Halomonas sedimenti]|tara:strand:+ start:27134 stop:28483 length:1350 start_codon:yes stop_codon:yes gene_type:complete
MAAITSLGIGSGLDLNGLLDQLKEAEQAKLEPIAQQIQSEDTKISAYGQLKSALEQFQNSAQALNDGSSFESLTTNVEGSAVGAVSSNEAQPGQYEVQVGQLATASSLVTERLETADESIVTGEQSLTFTLADGAMDPITIADGSSLEDMRDAINQQSDGRLSASIINDGEGYRLAVNSTETGADASIQSTNFSGILAGDVQTTDAQVVQAGQDAEFNVNGIDIVSPTNQVEGAIQGITLNLSEAGATSTVSVEQDSEAIREQVTAFVDDFNTLKDTITSLTAFDEETGQAAGLNADATTRAVERELRQTISSVVGGDGFSVLSDIGISLQVDGKLEIDEDKLDSIVANQPDQLASFFAGDSEEGGMAGQIATSLESLVGTGGRLESAVDSSERRYASLEERFTTTESRIEQTVDRYRTQFQAMDSMVAQMNSTSAYLTQQFAVLDQQS